MLKMTGFLFAVFFLCVASCFCDDKVPIFECNWDKAGSLAADIAAGWAREVLETNEPSTLGARFDRVWINGRRIK